MSNLKPCPFCGNAARIDSEYDSDGFGYFYRVKCTKCGAQTRPHFASHGNDCPNFYAEVRDDWEVRHTQTIEEQNKQLKSVLIEISDVLCGQGIEISGYHHNGDSESLDSLFDDHGWLDILNNQDPNR